MNIIDTHAHIYSYQFENDRDKMIERAKKLGVSKLLLPNIDLDSIEALHDTSDKYQGFCLPMMGLHPTSVSSTWCKDLETIVNHLNNDKRKYIAIGEIGIDLYWDKTYISEQIQAFESQLELAVNLNLPVAVHSRESYSEVLSSIKKFSDKDLRGVLHSFTGTQEDLDNIKKMDNFLIGINGIVTYKNSSLRDILKSFPLERIILETDSPYLAPVPHRGKRNEPAFLEFILKELSNIFQMSMEQISDITTKNAKALFNI